MENKIGIERLKELLERGKIGDIDDIIDAGDCIALDLGIKAIEINQKRLKLMENSRKEMNNYDNLYHGFVLDVLRKCEKPD